jgi:hypothetical protein
VSLLNALTELLKDGAALVTAWAAVLSAVAWPGVLVTAFLIFRPQIAERISKMTHASKDGFDFDVGDVVDKQQKKMGAAKDLDRAAMSTADELGLATTLSNWARLLDGELRK